MQELKLPQQSTIDQSSVFPLCLTTESNDSIQLINWLKSNQEELDNLLRKHKGIVFRDCGLKSVQDFHDSIVATGLLGMDYIGGAAVRTQLTERVFTANESPPSEKIPYHHEMAQTPSPPTHLFFFCEVPPQEGGETPILVSSEIYKRLKVKNPSFLESLEKNGVKYVRYMSEHDDPTSAIGRGWRSTFLTDSKEGAEAALKKLGSTWEWQHDNTLKTVTAILPAIREDIGTGRSNEKTFFNSMVAAFTGWNDSRNIGENAVVLGDGNDTVCDPQGIRDTIEIMNHIEVVIPWKAGDLMLLDNRTVMHSRRPFSGPRRILAGLVRDPDR